MSRRGGSNKQNAFAIPLAIVMAVLILILLFKGVSKLLSSSEDTNPQATQSFALVSPEPEAKMGIVMASSDTPTEIKEPSKLFATDKMLRVSSGNGKITLDNSQAKIFVESLTEISYLGNKSGKEAFQLHNGYAWIESPTGDNQVVLKHFSVNLGANTICIVNQNTLASNIYVLAGQVEIQGEKSTAQVQAGQMLSILKSQASSNNFGEMISQLDDNIKLSAIYSKNNGDAVLAQAQQTTSNTGSTTETGTGSSLSGSITANTQPSINITTPTDESTVDTDVITIEGTITGNAIKKITFDKVEAQIRSEDNTFLVKSFTLADKVNDIVFRTFDENGIQLQKGTLTVYLSDKKKTTKKPDVVTYPVSSKDFKISFPTENPYKTTERTVKIRGNFAPDLVKYVKVNSYQLQQFKQFGTSWTYNASIDNGNMDEGMNEYLVTYYGANDEVLATTKVYIVKDTPVTTPEVGTGTPGATNNTTETQTTSTGTSNGTTSGTSSTGTSGATEKKPATSTGTTRSN